MFSLPFTMFQTSCQPSAFSSGSTSATGIPISCSWLTWYPPQVSETQTSPLA